MFLHVFFTFFLLAALNANTVDQPIANTGWYYGSASTRVRLQCFVSERRIIWGVAVRHHIQLHGDGGNAHLDLKWDFTNIHLCKSHRSGFFEGLFFTVCEQTIICNNTFWISFSNTDSNIGSNLLTVLFYIPPTLSYTTTAWSLRVCSFPVYSAHTSNTLCANVTWHRVTRKKYIDSYKGRTVKKP